ncbi:hypothetical protein Tco_1506071 [Tanacetum coccineum]
MIYQRFSCADPNANKKDCVEYEYEDDDDVLKKLEILRLSGQEADSLHDYTPGELPLPSNTQSAKLYRMASKILGEANYNHYEAGDVSASVSVHVDDAGISEVRTTDTHTPIVGTIGSPRGRFGTQTTATCRTIGFLQNHTQSRKWMKLAADHGHRKARFEHGLTFFVVSLELAGRGGETAATHVKNVILQQLPLPSREWAIALANNGRALPSSR